MANNNIIFNSAFSGFVGGSQTRWLESDQAADYVSIRNDGLLFADAVDLAIPTDATLTQQEGDLMEAICAAIFSGRYPVNSPLTAFDKLALAIEALFTLARTSLLPVSGGGGTITVFPAGTTVINNISQIPDGELFLLAVTAPGTAGSGGARGSGANNRSGGGSGAGGGRFVGIITRDYIASIIPFNIESPTGGTGGIGAAAPGDGGQPVLPSGDFAAFGPITAFRGGNGAYGDSGTGTSRPAGPGGGGTLSMGADAVPNDGNAKAGGQPGNGIFLSGLGLGGTGGSSGGILDANDNAAGELNRSGRFSDSSGSGGGCPAPATAGATAGGHGGDSASGPCGGGAGASILSTGASRDGGRGGNNLFLSGGLAGAAGVAGGDGEDSLDNGITCGGTGGGGGGDGAEGGAGGYPGGGGGGGGSSETGPGGNGGNGGDAAVALLRLV